MSDEPVPVQVALARVMRDVRAVGKDHKMDPRAGGYAYRSVDDVYDALHGPLAEHGVVVLPDVVKLEATAAGGSNERHVAATLNVRVVGPAGDELGFLAHGEGMDRRDRATQKAVTDAFKYALLRLFCIPVTDDDTDEGATPPVESRPPRHRTPRRAPQPKTEPTSAELQAKIDEADQELDRLVAAGVFDDDQKAVWRQYIRNGPNNPENAIARFVELEAEHAKAEK